MDEKQFSQISDKLDKIVRLLALSIVRGDHKEQEKIALLDSIGFKPSEIDKLLQKSQGYSSVVLSQIRRRVTKSDAFQVTDSAGMNPKKES